MCRFSLLCSAAVLVAFSSLNPLYAQENFFAPSQPSLSEQMQANSVYLVKLDPRIAASDIPNTAQGLANRFGGSVLKNYTNVFGGFAIRMSDGAMGNMQQAKNTGIFSISRNYTYTVTAKGDKGKPPPPEPSPTCNETLDWGVDYITDITLDTTSVTCDVTGAYITTSASPPPTSFAGSSLKVCVLDTGVKLGHLANGTLAVGGHEDLGVITQYNALVNGAGFYEETPDDLYGHGTHVAGIIGAIAGNDKGVIGVAPGVPITSIKVLNKDGSGSTVDIVSGVDMAVALGCDIANLSLGGTADATDDPLETAIKQAALGLYKPLDANGDPIPTVPKNLKFTISAGNGGQIGALLLTYDIEGISPARTSFSDDDNIFTIASFSMVESSTGRGKTKETVIEPGWSYFSNYGPKDSNVEGGNNSQVDFVMPGGSIYSTAITESGYATYSGTSMAAPMLAGLLVRHLEGLSAEADANNSNIIPRNGGVANTAFGSGGFIARTETDLYAVAVAKD